MALKGYKTCSDIDVEGNRVHEAAAQPPSADDVKNAAQSTVERVYGALAGKKLRAAAMIYTPYGFIMVKDKCDKHKNINLGRLRKILGNRERLKNYEGSEDDFRQTERVYSEGRYALPGGKIEWIDFKEADALGILDTPRQRMNRVEEALFDRVVVEAVCREVNEELSLGIAQHDCSEVIRLNGKERDHCIVLAYGVGKIKISQKEIEGIGFLAFDPTIPLDLAYIQSHIRAVEAKILRDEYYRTFAVHRVSRLAVSSDLVEQWLHNCELTHRCRMRKTARDNPVSRPIEFMSSPIFDIYDGNKTGLNPLRIRANDAAQEEVQAVTEQSMTDVPQRASPGITKIHPTGQSPKKKLNKAS